MNTRSLLLVQLSVCVIMITIAIAYMKDIIYIPNLPIIFVIILGIQWFVWFYTIRKSLRDKIKDISNEIRHG